MPLIRLLLFGVFTLACLASVGLGAGGQRAQYEFEGQRLQRIVDGESELISCAASGGTGVIRGIARGPLGTVYVAADRGLFSVSDDVHFSAPMTLRGNAPVGEPRGIAVDSRGVIWLATTEAFGCIEPIGLVGQTVFEQPCSGLSMDATGALVVEQAGGERRYLPDLGKPEPNVTAQLLGEADSAGAPVGPDGLLRVRLGAAGVTNPVFGYRLLRRHRYQVSMDPDIEIELEPGSQTVEFVVFDQDLRRSVGLRQTVQVPYPKGMEKRTLIGAALLLVIATLGVALAIAHRAGGGRRRHGKAFVASVLFVVLVLQLIAGLIPHGRSWPFIGFSMYTRKYLEGETIYRPHIVGVKPNGSSFDATLGQAGYSSDGVMTGLVPLIHDGHAARERFLQAFNARYVGQEIEGYYVEIRRHRLTENGPVKISPMMIFAHPKELLDAH